MSYYRVSLRCGLPVCGKRRIWSCLATGTSSNDSCANADCQQGTCVPNDNVLLSILFPYKCQCNPGWATFQKVVPLLQVPSLPCNVPNCEWLTLPPYAQAAFCFCILEYHTNIVVAIYCVSSLLLGTLNLNCSGDSTAAAPSPSSPLTSANASCELQLQTLQFQNSQQIHRTWFQ